jgi:3-methyladenine DNA glycosylase Tag
MASQDMPSTQRWKPPRDDDEYFERMMKLVFAAGLNWKVVDNKWPNFKKAFAGFSIGKVGSFTGRDAARLMKDEGIVRNEKKIAATIENAGEFTRVREDFGSFPKYLESFGKNERKLLADMEDRFKHVGPSTARMFLWTVGYPLTPNAEEKKWMAENP